MLAADESVYRAALYPRMVLSGVIGPDKAVADFHNGYDEAGERTYTLSVGRGILLPNQDDVDDFGCRTAVAANQKKEQAKGAPLDRPGETVHYLGSFKLSVGDVLAAPARLLSIAVESSPLDGLDEHCDIILRRTAEEARKSEVSFERTRIIAHLRASLTDPKSHICDCDADLADMFADIRMVLLPAEETTQS
ncbi:hypothetical protein GGQ99_001353 [Aminobacter niigataensis]|uniref:Uncharacterized protein n=1 Tax=Aminobacter niigataensis TaxID=83265 RepID=A0ABR6KYM9_9HYPH|nr:hypothetical protein [Aminobacter niigataensis]MBB4649631.1 hypothetical protein [Aminobacter niigataensis]